MTDLYEELGLDRSLGIEELNAEVTKQEAVWKRRRTVNPDKATEKLALIVQAREAFSSEASRAEYDRKLADAGTPTAAEDPNKARRTSCQHYQTEAAAYCDAEEWQLAISSVEQAMRYHDPVEDGQDTDLLSLASRIYAGAGNPARALEYAKKTLAVDPYHVIAHLVVLDVLCDDLVDNVGDTVNYSPQRAALVDALDRALEATNHMSNPKAAGYIFDDAAKCYFTIGEDAEAKKFANKATVILEKDVVDSLNVLKAIEEEKQTIRNMEAENKAVAEKAQNGTIIKWIVTALVFLLLMSMCSH